MFSRAAALLQGSQKAAEGFCYAVLGLGFITQ